ncbi:MAG: hypothetical protein Tsb005_03160 [Gammaproteobacteria bacterium]
MFNSTLKPSITVCLLSIFLSGCGWLWSTENYPKPPANTPDVSAFSEIPVDFVTHWQKENSHPFVGSAVIDVNNDKQPEIFVGGGQNQADALLRYQQGKLVNIIQGSGLSNASATYGATAIDMNDDGAIDLLVARKDGLYLYLNNPAHLGTFSSRKIPLPGIINAIPTDVAVSDIDKDGDLDLYVSMFVDTEHLRSPVYNDPDHAKHNLLLLNNGNLTFTDIAQIAGVTGKQNTFMSVFVDLNNDSWEDLVLAQNTGEIEIYRNLGNRHFKLIPYASNYGFWMGMAVGDINQDGNIDLLITNIGNSIPKFLTKGDIQPHQKRTEDWVLLMNNGNFSFTDATEQYGLTGLGFAWGAVFGDLNYDGLDDLLVAQNYVKWPLHKLRKLPGKSMLQLITNQQNRFYQVDQLNLTNRYYGQTPLLVDINNDGKTDVIWINMNGPIRALLNQSTNHYVTVVLPKTKNYLGAKVILELADGTKESKTFVSSVGLMSDQAAELSFGLGKNTDIKSITIQQLNGKQRVLNDIKVDSKVFINAK